MSASPSRARVVLTCLLAAMLTALGAAPARADLHVHAGALPDGTATTVGPWSGLTDNAPGGVGTFGVSMGNVLEGWSRTATLNAPPNLSFVSATAQRHVNMPIGAAHSQPQAQTTWENRGHPYAGVSPYGGYPGDSASGPIVAANPAALSIRVACVNFDGVAGGCPPSWYLIDRLDLVLHDDDAPAVHGPLGGALVDGTWQTGGSASLTVNASDLGAGVYRAFVRTGGQTFYALADSAATRCRDARPGNADAYDFVPSALSLVPCQTAATTYTPTFDLTQMGDGTHVVSYGIEDAGGNERTVLTNQTLRINSPGGALNDPGASCAGGAYDEAGVCRPTSGGGGSSGGGGGGGGGGGAGGAGGVTPVVAPAVVSSPVVAPPAPPAPAGDQRVGNGTNASAGATLSLRANGQAVRRVSIAYGQQVVISGQLAGRGGTPIAGASLAVSSVRGRAGTPATPVITGADGSFRTVVTPSASGTIRFAYRAFADDRDDADSADLEIGVRAVARLRAAPRALRNGQAVTFRGQVAGAPAGSSKVVEMQVYQDGRWLTFATTRLRGGRFSHRYRFTRTRTKTRYVFRTVVRTDAGWPYETGSSNRVSVTVRP